MNLYYLLTGIIIIINNNNYYLFISIRIQDILYNHGIIIIVY